MCHFQTHFEVVTFVQEKNFFKATERWRPRRAWWVFFNVSFIILDYNLTRVWIIFVLLWNFSVVCVFWFHCWYLGIFLKKLKSGSFSAQSQEAINQSVSLWAVTAIWACRGRTTNPRSNMRPAAVWWNCLACSMFAQNWNNTGTKWEGDPESTLSINSLVMSADRSTVCNWQIVLLRYLTWTGE